MAKKKRKESPADEAPVDFETAMREVELIVNQLESGEAELSESLGIYETAIKRLKQCHELLGQAERRVTLLSGFDADGNPVTEEFEVDESESLESKQAARGRRRSGGATKSRKRSPKGTKRGGDGGSNVDDSPELF